MLLQTPSNRTFSRSRKVEVARRHHRTERPIIERVEAIIEPFDPLPEGGIVVAQTIGDPLDILYKRHIGQEEFDRLTLPVHQ
ncbi:MAG: hypothetical protein KAJ42_00815 [Gemmatimonadetes bacterium]|nr:hypothetical protein [Gemmatimonadota bacterium]